MQKYLSILALALLAACQGDHTEKLPENLVSKETFTTSIGDREVFGVAIRATADKKTYKGFAINFSVNEKVWLDTLKMELTPGDTLESEVIFSGAEVKENSRTELKIESFNIGE